MNVSSGKRVDGVATILVLLAFHSIVQYIGAFAASSTTLAAGPAEEAQIRKAVSEGWTVGLKGQVLRAGFLQDILVNRDVKVHRRGVRITDAIFVERIDLENAEILHEIRLERCHFEKGVNLSNSLFHKTLSFKGSTFTTRANFRRMEVRQDVVFTDATFDHELDFQRGNIAGGFEGSGLSCRSKEATATFKSMRVGEGMFLPSARFSGPVDLGGIDVGTQFGADGVLFDSKKGKVSFNAVNIRQDAFLRHAVFKGEAEFANAKIGRQFHADEAKFENKHGEADFANLKAGGTVSLGRAVFEGPTNFNGAEIGGNFEALEASFNSTSDPASFNGMQVSGSAAYTTAVFAGPVNCVGLEVEKQLAFKGAKFRNPWTTAHFNQMKVGETAFFDKVLFEGPVSFGKSQIGASLSGDEASFKKTADFSNVEVDGIASFCYSTFGGPVSLMDATFRDLSIEGDPRRPTIIPGLDLTQSSINRRLTLVNLVIANLDVPSLQVEGVAYFGGCRIMGRALFVRSKFESLVFSNIAWPERPGSVRLEGMKYSHIDDFTQGAIPERGDRLLRMLEVSRYDAQLYADLEASFRQRGNRNLSSAVFVAHKRRERKEVLSGFSWLVSAVCDYLLGYGRDPLPPLKCSGIAILTAWLVGWVVGWRKLQPKMEGSTPPKEVSEGDRGWKELLFSFLYSFWYAIDLFVPALDLQAQKVLKLEPHRGFATLWMGIVRLCGLVLVPTILAAVTGIIR